VTKLSHYLAKAKLALNTVICKKDTYKQRLGPLSSNFGSPFTAANQTIYHSVSKMQIRETIGGERL
jgi:hypothetical protein